MEDMPPHIYATAQSAYRNMMDTGRNQSLVLIGHSGSGKTANLKKILYYFSVISAKFDKTVSGNFFKKNIAMASCHKVNTF